MGNQNNTNNDSGLGKVFGVIGVVAGLSLAGQPDIEGGATLMGMIIFGLIGYAIGAWVEAVIIRILFIISVIITFLMNVAIRRFIWELLSGIFGG